MELLVENDMDALFCQNNGEGNGSSIVKILKDDQPTAEQLARLNNEYEITNSLNINGICKAVKKTRIDNKEALLFEYFKGNTLRALYVENRRTLKDVLKVSIKISGVLGELHQHNIIHKDINSNTILVSPDGSEVKIIDFSISSKISLKTPHLGNPDKLEGTLDYISPEQTGRMNRMVDHRTDLYSLGVTFYEMLTGTLPFYSLDSISLVHSHLAKTPERLEKRSSDIPAMVSDIVMKLLNKNAEDRYSSAWGLKDDLEECLDQLNKAGRIASFRLGSTDYFSQFKIPEKLYGREKETKELMDAFDRIGGGSKEMVLVAGYSGVGKSDLINEIQKPITEKRGFFISGKFDQFLRAVPYCAIVQSFKEFVNQLLTEDEEYLTEWKGTILQAVGQVGKVLTDVIPNLELVLGKQPAVSDLGGIESQNRFTYAFCSLLKSIATQKHPVVLFIDDLQWADTASLQVIKSLMTDDRIKYFLFVGAYRDHEVTPSHPSMVTIKEIQEEGGIIHNITLSNLSLANINQLTADALQSESDISSTLSGLVYEKTMGNPFFVNQFLLSLYENGLLTFEQELQSWQWDIEEIRSLKISDNVVELMAAKVQKLAAETQEILKLAACIGNRFDLSFLSIIHGKLEQETARQLWPAIEKGLIVPVGNNYKLVSEELAEAYNHKAAYQFIHDRIQQAVYSLIPKEDTRSVHLRIGRMLMSNIDKLDREEHLFDIVHHLNSGRMLIENVEEKVQVAALNLEAGKKARLSAAFQPALDYFKSGIKLMEGISWEHNYQLMLSLHSLSAEAFWLTNSYHKSDEEVALVLQNARTISDKINVYEVKMQSYITQGKLPEAVKVALTVLGQLGIHLPLKPSKLHVIAALLRIKFLLWLKGFENLRDLPVMEDPHTMSAMHILSRIGAPAYLAVPELMPLTILKMVELSVQFGNHKLSPFGYSAYGLLLCGVTGEIELGNKFGGLALDLQGEFDARQLRSRVGFIAATFIKHWKQHIRELLPLLKDAYKNGLEAGDMEFTAYSISICAFFSFVSGTKMEVVDQELVDAKEVIRRLRQETNLLRVAATHQVLLNLMGKSDNTYRLIGDVFNEDEVLLALNKVEEYNIRLNVYYNKLYLCYCFQQYEEGVENAVLARKYRAGGKSSILLVLSNFYESLTNLALFFDKTTKEKRAILKRIKSNQKKLQKWGKHAPMNYLHKFHLVEAEKCRVLGKTERARIHYEQSIALANEHNYMNEEALAYELSAKFYLHQDLLQLGRYYLQYAIELYKEWGAHAKVVDLKTRYANCLKGTVRIPGDIAVEEPIEQIREDSLDLSSILKASQTMSSEIIVQNLFINLISIVIENAGAEKGSLILQKKGAWFIQASLDTKGHKESVLQSIPIQKKTNSELDPIVSNAIVNFVIRTQKNLVLDHATKEEKFAKDPYISKYKPKSVLCMPIFRHRELYALLYLENNLTQGAFTSDHLKVLHLLSSQIAISIEHAYLYENLEEKVEERTAKMVEQKEEIEAQKESIAAQKKELEKKNRALRALNEDKNNLIYVVAHDLRGPLASIEGLVKIIELSISKLTEDQQECIEMINNSTRRLQEMIDKVLDVDAIESKQINVELQEVNLGELLAERVKSFENEARRKELTVHFLPSEAPSYVTADANYLILVYDNLLSNALKFSPRNKNIYVSIEEKGNKIRTIVRDEGPGINEGDMKKLFGKFQRLTARPTGGELSTGLGLSIVKKYIKAMGGKVSCESGSGSGASFIVELKKVKK